MAEKPQRSAADFLPKHRTLASLERAAAGCQGCDLYQNATQTVFGEGDDSADLVLVGEQPGDQEDRLGHPFIGPAGRILDRALADAGIGRARAYVTNAVKHFKWIRRGKLRLHKRPEDREIEACYPWLMAEVALLRPRVVVCLGVTAARAAFGRTVRLKDYRGSFVPTRLSPATFVTIHPSAILRLPEHEQRQQEYRRFVDDLRRVGARLENEA